MKRIAIFTSGGDAPGMNACIRAATRMAIHHGLEVIGIRNGFEGMISSEFSPLERKDVANILQRGGTILRSARSKAFRSSEGQQEAAQSLREAGIDGLVAIGGDGTYRGVMDLMKVMPELKVYGAPGTIDNDLNGTDYTIGYDTALNTVIWAVDRIRDTADAHNRLFFIEVMGRNSGRIAMEAGLAVGAEAVLVPERPTDVQRLIKRLRTGKRRHKNFGIIIVAEGDDGGGAYAVAEEVKSATHLYEHRVSILG
ncbi:MAG: ATP-dependent 6-phosphofructokinase, partial [Bacteroidota bacterium]